MDCRELTYCGFDGECDFKYVKRSNNWCRQGVKGGYRYKHPRIVCEWKDRCNQQVDQPIYLKEKVK